MTFQPNVLILSGVRGDTRRYRTLHLYEQLRLAGVPCLLSHLTDPRLMEQARNASVAILHRVANDGYVGKLFHTLRRNNALVVMDADDYLYDTSIMRWIDSPDFQDPVRAALYRQEILRHRAALEACDAVTVSTDALAGMVAPLGKPVRVHRNAYSLEMLALSEQAYRSQAHEAGKVVIGYASGTRTHDRDFAQIQPVLRSILEQYPQAELWLMGAVDTTQTWGALQGRVRFFPLVPWRELPARLLQLDINLAPLVPQSPFNQAKSEIKFMEAALTRVPTIASRTDAFAYAIQHGRTGYLADGTEEWHAALERLVQDADARRSMGHAAYQDVLERYAPLARGEAMARLLSEFAGQAGRAAVELPACPDEHLQPAIQAKFLSPQAEDHPTMAELARYSILHRGILTLLGQIWIYFRRKLAPIFPFRTPGDK